MNYLKDIIMQLEELSGIKDIVGASEEIASMKMRGIRSKVLLSRDLNDELTEIYREVTISYKTQILLLLQGQQNAKKASNLYMSLKKGNGRTACVFLAANSGSFSRILDQTYNEFISYLEQHDVVPVIIGEFGKKRFENQFPDRDFVFYPFVEDNTQEDNFKKITTELAEYANAIIFFSHFESMASQSVSSLDVSGIEKPLSDAAIPTVHYLFEPSLEKVLEFFEKEIFAGIIQQTVTESELARYASRITTLDVARENINTKLKAINLEKRFASHRLLNKKQNEAMIGISLWKLA